MVGIGVNAAANTNSVPVSNSPAQTAQVTGKAANAATDQTTAQVTADMLAITPDNVSMNSHVDSLISPFLGHSGVYSNKFNDVDLGAVIMATKKIRDTDPDARVIVLTGHESELMLGRAVEAVLQP